jgi:subtilase family serine protease
MFLEPRDTSALCLSFISREPHTSVGISTSVGFTPLPFMFSFGHSLEPSSTTLNVYVPSFIIKLSSINSCAITSIQFQKSYKISFFTSNCPELVSLIAGRIFECCST